MEKTVLITGANRGLGLGLLEKFAQKGYAVFAAARSPEKSPELQKLSHQFGGKVFSVSLDVESTESVKKAFLAVSKMTQHLDILINNAGRYGKNSDSKIWDLDFSEVSKTFDVNTLGPLRVTSAFLPLLKKGKEKKLVQITSLMGSIEDNGSGGSYDYRLSKAALNMLNKNFSVDLGKEGFTCVTVHPGWVQTDMGGKQAPMKIDESVSKMTDLILSIKQSHNGSFLNFDGKSLPY